MPQQPSFSRFAWKKAPFIRIVIPFIAGIICAWYLPLPPVIGWTALVVSLFTLSIISVASLSQQFRYRHYSGLCLHTLLFATGLLLLYYKNSSHQPGWINKHYIKGSTILATLDEPLSEKKNSYKAIATARIIKKVNGANERQTTVKGKILLYFLKGDSKPPLQQGDQLLIGKTLMEIRNSGNPGNFNYHRFCAFREISYQVFLKPGEYDMLKIKNENLLKKFLFTIRQNLVDILSKYITGQKESGLAEAMLIGFKDDLDKDLIQSYSNTGVIHLIAISGLHLGLIYWLLLCLCKPLGTKRAAKWMRPVIIISGLWLFSLAAGGSPSVIRAAVMFSCLVLGNSLSRNSSIYNSLAASAFLLLCYNPFWLWHPGFQLSYAAVLSIVLFMKPIYNCLFFQNKLSDITWKLTAVTLSAQVLTFPLVIFHFHQFPNLFLLTNLVAVPAAGIILAGAVFLCLVSFIPPVATVTGYLLTRLISLLNSFIELFDRLPFTVSGNLQLSEVQTIFLYGGIAGFTAWFLYKKKSGVVTGLTMMAVFTGLRAFSFWTASQQQKLIVYNIPNYQAIDFINGRSFLFKGDSILLQDGFLKNFHLNPSRTLHRVSPGENIPGLYIKDNFYQLGNKSVLIADDTFKPGTISQKPAVDVIILSKNPDINIHRLTNAFSCRQFVIDGSNNTRKVIKWKQECEQLNIACHATSLEGAFVLNLH